MIGRKTESEITKSYIVHGGYDQMKHSKIIGLLLIFTLVIMTSAMFLGGCNDKNDNAAPGFYSENTDPADSCIVKA